MELLLESLLNNPNLIYLLLIFGLWVGVTSAYIPGTGLPELGSLVLVGGSLFLLTQMPTNWLALVLMIIGVSGFFVLPFVRPERALWAELGLILQGVGALVLFDGMSVSPVLIVATIGLAWAYHHYILLPMMRSLREASFSEKDADLVGARGEITSLVDPRGTAYVRGENWTVRSTSRIEAGTPVVVMEQHGLELVVEKAKRDD